MRIHSPLPYQPSDKWDPCIFYDSYLMFFGCCFSLSLSFNVPPHYLTDNVPNPNEISDSSRLHFALSYVCIISNGWVVLLDKMPMIIKTSPNATECVLFHLVGHYSGIARRLNGFCCDMCTCELKLMFTFVPFGRRICVSLFLSVNSLNMSVWWKWK